MPYFYFLFFIFSHYATCCKIDITNLVIPKFRISEKSGSWDIAILGIPKFVISLDLIFLGTPKLAALGLWFLYGISHKAYS